MIRRKTSQRQVILDVVKSRCDHPKVEQIIKDVHQIDPKISVGTIYRNLDILSNEGRILSVKMPDADRYDFNIEHHNHFVCERCGKVFDIDVKYDDSLDEKKTNDGFYINNHQTLYRGFCPKCMELMKK